MRRYEIMMALLLLGGCGDQQASTDGVRPRTKVAAKPVSNMVFDHLPLSGDLSTATAAGFGDCLAGNYGLRCRKENVMVMGVGPLSAAVDLDAGAKDEPARFDHVTLWHATDQGAVLDLGMVLKKAGWQSCLTTDDERYLTTTSPIRVAIDTSYWGIRRLVISAPQPGKEKYC